MLDRLLLISCICIVVALILYFFYWNRILGFLLGLVFRILYWNKEASSCWVQIGQFICLSKPLLLDHTVNRFHTLFFVDRTNLAQGRPLPFQQPDNKDCQRTNSMALLDQETHDGGRVIC